MTKYAPLGEHLRKQFGREVRMTFGEIERVIGTRLPPKAQNHPAWWSNNPSNNVMTKVWLEAGFRTEQVDIPSRRLVFRRVNGRPGVSTEKGAARRAGAQLSASVRRHPAFGALKGMIRLPPGADLEAPADANWGRESHD